MWFAAYASTNSFTQNYLRALFTHATKSTYTASPNKVAVNYPKASKELFKK
jgi:hypothetical protein